MSIYFYCIGAGNLWKSVLLPFKARIYMYFPIDIRIYTFYNGFIKGSAADEGIRNSKGNKKHWMP